MASYRLYCLDCAGQISLAEWIDAENDQIAIGHARQRKNGALKCEVWKGNQLVARMQANDLVEDSHIRADDPDAWELVGQINSSEPSPSAPPA